MHGQWPRLQIIAAVKVTKLDFVVKVIFMKGNMV